MIFSLSMMNLVESQVICPRNTFYDPIQAICKGKLQIDFEINLNRIIN
jgi:hypothetical protein